MDEPDPTAEPPVREPVADADAVAEESAVARGSQLIKITPERSGRSENSVVEGMPDGKTERIASMRRELADLQQHLIQAQQRVATELQGRAEDAERLESLEAFVTQHELDSHKDAARVGELEAEIAALRTQLTTAATTTEGLRRDLATRDGEIQTARRDLEARSAAWTEAKTLLEARDAELATHTTERDTERATRSRLELDLEDVRREHRNVAEQLDLQFTSLRDAKALITTLSTELATITSERDALKNELEPARRDLDATRTKLRDVASQLVRLGQDLGDGGVATPAATTPWITSTSTVAPATASSEPKSATTSVKRTMPPPIPHTPSQPRPVATTAPVEVEAIVMTEEAKPASRIGSALFMLGGVIVGCVVTAVIMKSSSTDEVSASPAPAPSETSPTIRHDEVAPAPTPPPSPAPSPSPSGSARNPVDPPVTPAITTDGVIVLPASAAGHRLFIDGKVIEVKGSRATVACGSHEVRIGSSGTARKLDIACGGETVLPDEPN